MATITISYKLSETGRKASLATGGDGKCHQSVTVLLTPELLEIADVNNDGRATYDSRRIYDAPITDVAAAAITVAAERAKESAEAEARRAAERAQAIAHYEADMLALRNMSPAQWDYTGHGLKTIAPRGSEYYTHELPADLKIAVDAEYNRRREIANAAEATEKKRTAEATAKRIAERDIWIKAHGSARLQKGLALDQIETMFGVYRDERIAHDIGIDWIAWGCAVEPEDNDLLNPNETYLDALAEARAQWPQGDVQLRSVGGTNKHGDEHEWRPVLMMAAPWNSGPTVILYLNAK
jgi:hypothetical protein